MTAYPVLAKQALRVLMAFATTYLCEAGFSALTAVKTKYRQRLDAVEKDLRLKLSSIAPNIGELCAKMQAHPSHYSNMVKYLAIGIVRAAPGQIGALSGIVFGGPPPKTKN